MSTFDKELGASTVVRGSRGQLFHRDNGACEQVTGQTTLEPAEVLLWADLIRTRVCHARALKAEYFMLIAPEKHVVYGDALPPDMHVSPNRPVTKLLDHLRTTELFDRILYPADILREARVRKETYSTVDTHWNGFGAYLVYEELCKLISSKIPVPIMPIENLVFNEFVFGCDLGERFSPPESGIHIDYRKHVSTGHGIFDNTIFNRGNVRVLTNPKNPDLPSLVMFRDSFSTNLLPLLAESFRRIVAISAPNYDVPEILESERPEVVIAELAERYVPLKQVMGAAAVPFETLSGMTPQMIAEKV